jgi:2-ketocyclohexanecarboxyl-CoA hydrolase
MTEGQDGAAGEERDEVLVLYEMDNGFGTGYMTRIIGEKRAREVWLLCRRYSNNAIFGQNGPRVGSFDAGARYAGLRTGPLRCRAPTQAPAEVRKWADEMLAMAPTTLRFLKYSFNVDTGQFAGIELLATSGLATMEDSPGVSEGFSAFNEKRRPDFSAFRERAYRGA